MDTFRFPNAPLTKPGPSRSCNEERAARLHSSAGSWAGRTWCGIPAQSLQPSGQTRREYAFITPSLREYAFRTSSHGYRLREPNPYIHPWITTHSPYWIIPGLPILLHHQPRITTRPPYFGLYIFIYIYTPTPVAWHYYYILAAVPCWEYNTQKGMSCSEQLVVSAPGRSCSSRSLSGRSSPGCQ